MFKIHCHANAPPSTSYLTTSYLITSSVYPLPILSLIITGNDGVSMNNIEN